MTLRRVSSDTRASSDFKLHGVVRFTMGFLAGGDALGTRNLSGKVGIVSRTRI